MYRDGVRRLLEADVRCYCCGHSAGLLRRQDARGSAPMLFLARSSGVERPIRSLAALHCPRCAGSLYIEEVEVVHRYDPSLGAPERPARGRPRKRVTAGERLRSA